MIHEFSGLIPVTTKLGKGYALFVEATNHDYYWTIILDDGSLVTFKQEHIKIARSFTYDRNLNNSEMIQILMENKLENT